MGGGLPRHSTTLLMGPTGTGKTTLGLHFLSQCSQEVPGLYFGVYEGRSAIIAKAKALGIPVSGLIEGGQVELMWQPTTEGMFDEVCQRLLSAVRRRHVKRLFIDGLGGFETLAADPARLSHVFAALSNEFRALDVSVIYTAEADLIGSVSGLPLSGLSLEGVPALAENIVIMRFVQLRSRVHRVISVLKVRDRANEATVRAFSTTSTGLVIEPDATSAEAILAEAAQQSPFTSNQTLYRRDD
jgi:circadian clock protein KaiC